MIHLHVWSGYSLHQSGALLLEFQQIIIRKKVQQAMDVPQVISGQIKKQQQQTIKFPASLWHRNICWVAKTTAWISQHYFVAGGTSYFPKLYFFSMLCICTDLIFYYFWCFRIIGLFSSLSLVILSNKFPISVNHFDFQICL